ncbi:Abscisic acid 8'-hydroxylase 2 [Rhynchospora pubera]|uniref:(+)-abscisic acid 8'-hydroxylase n=1 Tax=Rhynchospora pubera TaxID=906938 RepID=A0AAV8BQ85_9POAL|nr:Abscisic acid 8'-hydroxylase 2 [Rhynchospora pubera]
MVICYSLIYTIIFISFLFFLFMRKNHRRAKYNQLRLPPGYMGWPYVGETLQLYSQNPNLFFSSRIKRYGEVFKTHILGCPCVMLASPEAARFVLVTHAHLFKPTYPKSKERMIGPWALFFHQGDYHLKLRKIVQSSLSPEPLRAILPDIESIVRSILHDWDGQVETTFHAMKRLSFDVGIHIIFGGQLDDQYKKELKKNYLIVDKGYNSFAINLPGTPYHKAMQARKRLSCILSEIMEQRRKKGESGSDLLGCMIDSKDEDGCKLSDEQIADNVIGVLFAAQDTTASVLTWIIKYLHDYPKVHKLVKAEQMEIFKANECGNKPLTWTQSRSMTITNRVILESLRMASIISFTFREAVADVEYKGYLIPKGWKVMPLFRNIHHNSEFFQDPEEFDSSRFKVAPKPNTFMPFGSGVHACPGNELARIEILVLIYHLVTNYRWEVVGSSNEVEYSPFPVPKQGLPVKLWRISDDNKQ